MIRPDGDDRTGAVMAATVPHTKDSGSALQELLTLPPGMENPYIREWKERGGKIIGYTCSYVPEETLCAVGDPPRILPVRLGAQGCATTEDADIFMHKFLCSYCRCLMQLALTGAYDYLDGLVLTSGCEHMRRTFELWRDQVRVPFLAMLAVPHCRGEENHFRWYLEEVSRLTDRIEGAYGWPVSGDSLQSAVRTHNRYRELVARLYALRAADPPRLTGTEAMRIAQAGFRMPKEAFNAKLSAALEELALRPGLTGARARVLVSGSYLDDPSFVEMIESTGAVVVTDALCAGRRFIEGKVDETAGPLDAVARRTFLRDPSCPRMVDGYAERVAFTKRIAAEAGVHGAIFTRIPFCDSHAVENQMEGRDLESLGIPTLHLERECFGGDRGRLKTRVQAFLEKIGR